MKKLFCLLMACTLVFTNIAYARLVFNDPIHTYQSALNTMQLIKAEYTRLEQLKNQIEQLKDLGDLSSWKGKSLRDFAALNGYIGSLKTIYGDIGAQTGRLRQRLDQAKIAKLSYQEYMQQEQQLVKEGETEAIRRHDDDVRALQKTQSDYSDVKTWEDQVRGGLTEMGSAQMMNQQLNKLITQNAEVLKVMVASRMEQRGDVATEDVQKKRGLLALRELQSKRAATQLKVHEKSMSSLPKSPLQN